MRSGVKPSPASIELQTDCAVGRHVYFCSVFFSAAAFCAATVQGGTIPFSRAYAMDWPRCSWIVGDQDVDDVAGIRLWTEFWQELRELGICHALDGLLCEIP